MKQVKLPLILLVLAFFANDVRAQTPVPDADPYVNQYIAGDEANRSMHWWRALEKELVLAVAQPAGEVSETSLQNIIFFAQVHADRIDLNEAVPFLLEVYRDHENEGTRLMALSALHAIGNRRAMNDLRTGVARESSPRVKRLTIAALSAFYR